MRESISVGLNWCSESNTEEEILTEGRTTSIGCVIPVDILSRVVVIQVVVAHEERK